MTRKPLPRRPTGKRSPRIVLDLTVKEAWLVREAIAYSCQHWFTLSRAKRRKLVDVAEHKILRALLRMEVTES